MTAPVQFGIEHVAPLLPKLFAAHPEVTIDLHLSDQALDLVGEGFDLAVRITTLADSSLRVRRLCDVRAILVGAPSYFATHGRPTHPRDLAAHKCFAYAYQSDPHRWRFVSPQGEEVAVAPNGPLRANSGEAFLPALRAGSGLAILPEFMVWPDVKAERLEPVLCDWPLPSNALNLVMPPGGPTPARVTAVINLLARHLSNAPWARMPPREARREGRRP